MSETTVRPVASMIVPSAPLREVSSTAAPSSPSSQANVDAIEPPHRYIVFGDRQHMQLAAPRLSGIRRGTMPAGDPWTTADLTAAEVQSLRSSGLQVVEDRLVHRPPVTRSSTDGGLRHNQVARAVHGANELAKLGPEWEGKGGFYISIDTGAAKHKDLPDTKHFDDVDTEAPEDPQFDDDMHGTHTAGLAVGRGNPDKGGVRGMAPRADYAAAKVLDKNGEGPTSNVLKGIEDAVRWARERPHSFIVVNLSLGDEAGDPASDPIVQAIEQATHEQGILFTVSAGNSGRREGTIETPGIAPDAITVGAMDHRGTVTTKDDRVAWFSSRDVASGAKPTLTADGVNVRSTIPGNDYANLDGTSMASPITGGGSLALGQGLLEMYERGELLVDPRDLVRSGEFQRIIREATLDNASVPTNVEGGGDLRLMKARELFLARYSTRAPHGPSPYFPGSTPGYTPRAGVRALPY